MIGYEKITGQADVPLSIFADMLTANGLRVMDAIAVCADRWRSLHWKNPECCLTVVRCPDRMRPRLCTSWLRGSAPLASREAVASRVAAGGTRAEAVGRECERQSTAEGVVTIARGVAAWARILGASEVANVADLSDDTVALAVLALHADDETTLRDALLAWMQPGTLPLDVVDEPTIALLREHLPFPWQDGADPGYRLALLLQRMISLCIRPDA